MYRIYINQAVLILSESDPVSAETYQQVKLEDFDFIPFCKDLIFKDSASNYLIITKNINQIFKKITSCVRIIRAAGGVVRNEKDEFLFIFRRGKWDLPKGKVEMGEDVKEAATREVEEECGIRVKQTDYLIGETYHVYELHGQLIMKQTSWYAMSAVDQFVLVPQIEEDITEVRWLSALDFGLILQNTYPLIREVISWVVH